MTRSNAGLAEPPEGVISGENVPQGSEPDNYDEALLQKVEGLLKSRGSPYTEMGESELREKAIKTVRMHGVKI